MFHDDVSLVMFMISLLIRWCSWWWCLLGGVHGGGDCSVFHDDQLISLLGGVHGGGDCSVLHDDQLISLLVVFMVVVIVVCSMMIN